MIPAGSMAVLSSQARDDLVAVDPEARQLPGVKFEIDLFVLRSDQRDLRSVRDCQELGSDLLDIVAQLAGGKPVRGKGVDRAEGVAEPGIEERVLNALG